MSKNDLFIKYHWRSSIVLGILVLAVVFLNPALYNFRDFGLVITPVVMGEATIVPPANSDTEAVVAYQHELRSIVHEYLQARSAFNAPSQDWLFLIDRFRHRLSAVIVPDRYEDLHFKIIMTLNNEQLALQQGQSAGLDEADVGWHDIISQFYWLE